MLITFVLPNEILILTLFKPKHNSYTLWVFSTTSVCNRHKIQHYIKIHLVMGTLLNSFQMLLAISSKDLQKFLCFMLFHWKQGKPWDFLYAELGFRSFQFYVQNEGTLSYRKRSCSSDQMFAAPFWSSHHWNNSTLRLSWIMVCIPCM